MACATVRAVTWPGHWGAGLPDALSGLDCNRCTLTYFCVSGLVILNHCADACVPAGVGKVACLCLAACFRDHLGRPHSALRTSSMRASADAIPDPEAPSSFLLSQDLLDRLTQDDKITAARWVGLLKVNEQSSTQAYSRSCRTLTSTLG